MMGDVMLNVGNYSQYQTRYTDIQWVGVSVYACVCACMSVRVAMFVCVCVFKCA